MENKEFFEKIDITEEQLLHIFNRHPEAYNEIINHIREILKYCRRESRI